MDACLLGADEHLMPTSDRRWPPAACRVEFLDSGRRRRRGRRRRQRAYRLRGALRRDKRPRLAWWPVATLPRRASAHPPTQTRNLRPPPRVANWRTRQRLGDPRLTRDQHHDRSLLGRDVPTAAARRAIWRSRLTDLRPVARPISAFSASAEVSRHAPPEPDDPSSADTRATTRHSGACEPPR